MIKEDFFKYYSNHPASARYQKPKAMTVKDLLELVNALDPSTEVDIALIEPRRGGITNYLAPRAAEYNPDTNTLVIEAYLSPDKYIIKHNTNFEFNL